MLGFNELLKALNSSLSENLYLPNIFTRKRDIRVFKSSIFLPNLACFVSVSFVNANNVIPDVTEVSVSREGTGFEICEKCFVHL